MFRLHYNKSNGIYSVRRLDRSTVAASERHGKLPLIGDTVELSPRVHLLVTRYDYLKAKDKKRPVLSVAVTRFPFVRLLWKFIKETF